MRWGTSTTVYFRYIETARIAWFEEIGALPDPGGEGPVIVNAYCSFIKQLTYPGEIEVSTFAGPPGRSSFEVTHEKSAWSTPTARPARCTPREGPKRCG